jgi:curved DNA-binding protein CbpA
MSYSQYYDYLKQQNGGSIHGVALDLGNVDPYEVLEVRKNFTWDELKNAYRNKAMAVHPDKGGSEEVFNLVTDCFKQLGQEYKMKIEAKPHHELKSDYNDFMDRNRPIPTRETRGQRDDGDFQKRFNRIFEDNKLNDDENDIGYGHLMEASSSKREDIDIPKTMSKFNNDRFNSTFDKQTPMSKQVTVYKEPEPMQLARTIQYTELGGKVDDYSSAVERSERKGLQYTDYMKAHTTNRLIDPRTMKERKSYKNVEDYENARRDVVSRSQTDEERQRIKDLEEQQEKAEYDRMQRLRHRDEAISQHYQRVNGLLTR